MFNWIQSVGNYQVLGVPLYVIIGCGILGVLVDTDHPIGKRLGINERFTHIPMGIISLLVLCVSIAHF
jgi:hypothetical protein